MSRDVAPDFRRIRVFLTNPHPCSYLPGSDATTAFVASADPNLEVISHIEINTQLYSQLSDMGFRRSGQYFYSPRCKSCDASLRRPQSVRNLQHDSTPVALVATM